MYRISLPNHALFSGGIDPFDNQNRFGPEFDGPLHAAACMKALRRPHPLPWHSASSSPAELALSCDIFIPIPLTRKVLQTSYTVPVCLPCLKFVPLCSPGLRTSDFGLEARAAARATPSRPR